MPRETIEGLALSPPQAHLWRLRDEEPGDPWRTRCVVRIAGVVDAGRILAALTRASGRHEILRTRLAALGDGTPVPVVETHPAISVEREDRRDAGAGSGAAIEAELLAGDGAGGPCVRAVLATLAAADHVLLLDLPAALADPAAAVLLVAELAAIIAGEEPDGGPDAPPPYAETARWMLEMLDAAETAAGRAHWHAIDLAGLAEARLGLELPGAPAPAFRPAEHAFLLPAATRAAAHAAAKALGVAPAALLLAAWQLLLSRHGEQPRSIVGVAVDGRGYEGLERAIGLFQRTLPIAVEVDAAAPFAGLVRRTVAAVGAAEDHFDSFALSRFAPGLAFLPHAFQHLPAAPRIERGGIAWEIRGRRAVVDRCRLALLAEEAGDGTAVRLRYDPSVLEAADVARLAAQYRTLLASAARDVHAPAGTLSMVDEAERRLLTADFARVPTRTAPRLIPDLIGEQAARAPAAVAVAAAEGTLTYGELEAAADRLARRLREAGAGPGTIAGIHARRSPAMIAAILGTLRAGAAYLPLPPTYPRERIAFMLADSGATVVLTSAADRPALDAGRAAVIVIDEVLAGEAAPPAPAPPEPAAGDLAYVIYTSGSTGRPKGVPITHGNLACSTRARFDTYRRPVAGYLLLSSFAFDSSVPGIFWTLAQGGRLVLPPEGFEQDVAALPGLIAAHRASHLLGLPSVYSLLLDAAAPGQLDSLRTVIVAGEACPRGLVERHFARLPAVELFNEYGPTEGTVWSTVHDCSLPSRRTLVPIGRPVPGVDVLLLDERGAPAPVGLPGEIHVGGPQLTPGYLGRPELNAARFVADPFRAGGRLYRTGDLGRFLSDGTIEFLGRLDHQVKIRGYRIELEEIETVLVAHPSVREAVVLAREDQPGDQRLVAYVAPAAHARIEAAALRAHLAGPLPEFMVPGHFVLLDALPRLPNGKVDRRALPPPERARAAAGAAPPATALEKVLAGIWADLLGAEEVGADEDFFARGGHSLLAVQLFARLRDTLQVDAPLRLLFDNSTIRDLARALTADPAEGRRLERTAELVLQVLGLAKV
ncbi:MAG: amino acid adenylation domain-containing protein [Planctomycetota bacterium]